MCFYAPSSASIRDRNGLDQDPGQAGVVTRFVVFVAVHAHEFGKHRLDLLRDDPDISALLSSRSTRAASARSEARA